MKALWIFISSCWVQYLLCFISKLVHWKSFCSFWIPYITFIYFTLTLFSGQNIKSRNRWKRRDIDDEEYGSNAASKPNTNICEYNSLLETQLVILDDINQRWNDMSCWRCQPSRPLEGRKGPRFLAPICRVCSLRASILSKPWFHNYTTLEWMSRRALSCFFRSLLIPF